MANNTDSEFKKNYAYEFTRPRRKKSENFKACAPEPTACEGLIYSLLRSKGYNEIQRKISLLYEHWEMVLGEDLAKMALPIGRREKTLLIAGEDSVAMNELTYARDEILESVHSFFGEEYFEKIEIHLLKDKKPLNKIVFDKPEIKVELVRPENLGKLNLPEGKVRDAYLHYLSLFEK